MASHGHAAALEAILQEIAASPAAAAKIKDKQGRLPLHRAMVHQPPPNVVATLLQAYNAAAKAETRRGTLPLHIGMEHRASAETIQLLLEAFPAAAKHYDDFRMLPLRLGVYHQAPGGSIQHVLAANTDAASDADQVGRLPLHYAVEKHASAEVIAALLEAFPAAAEHHDVKGMRPVHVGMEHQAPVSVIRQLLHADPAAAFAAARGDNLPLHVGMAHQAPAESVTAVLAANRRAARAPNVDGMCPLHLGMECNAPTESIRNVLNADSDVAKLGDNNGRYPLWIGLLNGASAKSILRVLRAFPDAARTITGYLHPLHIAMENGAPAEAVVALLEADAAAASVADEHGLLALHWGVKHGAAPESIELVLRANPAAAAHETKSGMMALHFAVQCRVAATPAGNTKVIALLLNGDVSAASTPDSDGCLPLRSAIKNHAPAASIKLLLDAYTDAARVPNAEDGCLPLHDTIRARSPAEVIMAVVAAHPAAVGTENADRRTPLHDLLCALAHFGADLARWVLQRTPMQAFKAEAMRPLFEPDAETGAEFTMLGLLLDASPPTQVDAGHAWLTGKGTLPNSYDGDARCYSPCCGVGRRHTVRRCYSPGCPCSRDLRRQHGNAPDPDPLDLCGGWSALDLAIYLGYVGAFKWLLEQHKAGVTFEQERHIRHGDPEHANRRAVLAARTSRDTEIKKWGDEYGRLLGRYEVASGAKHVSDTCVVIFAEDTQDCNAPVALKLMYDSAAWMREVGCREKLSASDHVIAIRDKRPDAVRGLPELTVEELRGFPQIRLVGDHTVTARSQHVQSTHLPYLLVMPRASDGDLFDAIQHMNVAGTNRALAVGVVAVGVAKALKYINAAGVMHGDVKPRNVVPLKDWKGYAIIDLDAAADIDGQARAGQKPTSSGCVPPEQAVVLLYGRQGAAPAVDRAALDALDKQLEIVKADLARANEEDDDAEVQRLWGVKTALRRQRSGPTTLTKPSPVWAAVSYDMWCFGVLLYELCTGRRLFDWDTKENVTDVELAKIAAWPDDLKNEKLKEVKPGWPRSLLGDLLHRDPTKRPANWTVVINQLEFEDAIHDTPESRFHRAIHAEKTVLNAGLRILFRREFHAAHGHAWIDDAAHGTFLWDGGPPPWDLTGPAVLPFPKYNGLDSIPRPRTGDLEQLDATALRALLIGKIHTGLAAKLLRPTIPHSDKTPGRPSVQGYNVMRPQIRTAILTQGDVVAICVEHIRNKGTAHGHSATMDHRSFAKITELLDLFADKCLPDDDRFRQLVYENRAKSPA